MRLPGFTAEASLVKTRQHYQTAGIIGVLRDAGKVVPQQDFTFCVPSGDGTSQWCWHYEDPSWCYLNPPGLSRDLCIETALYYNARCYRDPQTGTLKKCDPANPDLFCCTKFPVPPNTGGQGGPGYPFGFGRPLPQ